MEETTGGLPSLYSTASPDNATHLGFCFQQPSYECSSLTQHLSVINKVQCCVCVQGELRWWWGSLCQDKRGNDLAVTSFFLSATAQCLAREQESLFFFFFLSSRGLRPPEALVKEGNYRVQTFTIPQLNSPPPSSLPFPSLSDFHSPVPMFIRFWGTVF